MFALTIVPIPEQFDEILGYRGTITLGDHSEDFIASSFLWDAAAYERQWRAAATALATGAASSAFITSFAHPDATWNMIWPAWRLDQLVFIQNRLLLREGLPTVVDPGQIERFVGDRRTRSTDGGPISEWVVSLADVAAFAA